MDRLLGEVVRGAPRMIAFRGTPVCAECHRGGSVERFRRGFLDNARERETSC